MWKYEPEDYGDDKSKHLRGAQFTKYQPAVTMGYEFTNDGDPIIPEPTEPVNKKIARQEGNKKRQPQDL